MEMNVKKICFIGIIGFCVIALSYGIYYEAFGKNQKALNEVPGTVNYDEDKEFDDLIDNQIHYQDYDSRKFCK